MYLEVRKSSSSWIIATAKLENGNIVLCLEDISQLEFRVEILITPTQVNELLMSENSATDPH